VKSNNSQLNFLSLIGFHCSELRCVAKERAEQDDQPIRSNHLQKVLDFFVTFFSDGKKVKLTSKKKNIPCKN